MKVKQVNLTHNKKRRFAWIESKEAIFGHRITLKGEDPIRWTITKVYDLEVDTDQLHRDWNNNI